MHRCDFPHKILPSSLAQILHLVKLQACENARRFKHAVYVVQGGHLVCEVPDHERDGVEIDADHVEVLSLASTQLNLSLFAHSVCRLRFLPLARTTGLISETMMREEWSLLTIVAWDRRQKAMSSVPRAMSRMVWVAG